MFELGEASTIWTLNFVLLNFSGSTTMFGNCLSNCLETVLISFLIVLLSLRHGTGLLEGQRTPNNDSQSRSLNNKGTIKFHLNKWNTNFLKQLSDRTQHKPSPLVCPLKQIRVRAGRMDR